MRRKRNHCDYGTASELIDDNLFRDWIQAKKSRARYLNLCGYNVAVMSDHSSRDEWVYRIVGEGEGAIKHRDGFSRDKYNTENGAKAAVLKVLATKLNLQ